MGHTMASGPRLQAAHHRDVAAQFRALADIEPSDSLRDRLNRIAARYDELASNLEAKPADELDAAPNMLGC
jgi:hypothetical protein